MYISIEDYDSPLLLSLVSFQWVIGLFAMAISSFALFILIRHRTRLSNMPGYFLLVLLLMDEYILIILTVWHHGYIHFYGKLYPLLKTREGCIIDAIVVFTCGSISSFIVAGLALERASVIVFNGKAWNARDSARFVATITFIQLCVISAPFFTSIDLDQVYTMEVTGTFCFPRFDTKDPIARILVWIMAATCIVSMNMVTTSFFLIFQTIRKLTHLNRTKTSSNGMTMSFMKESNASSHDKRLRRDIAVMKKTALLVMSYTICWTPLQGIVAYQLFTQQNAAPLAALICDICYSFTHLSSSLILVVFNERVKECIKKDFEKMRRYFVTRNV